MSAHLAEPHPRRISRIRGSIRGAEYRFVATILIPAVLFYAAFRFYPLGFALYMSLFDWKLLRAEQFFVGLDNYATIFADPLFLQVIRNTLYFAFGSTLLGSTLALILAIILNPIQRGSAVLRLIFFLPVMTSTIASATIWLWLYQTRFGLLNQLLVAVQLPRVQWLISPEWAMPSIILMSVWGGVGFTMIIFLAGLRGIPTVYYEAASIDGATEVQQVRFITIPLLTPVVAFVLVTGLIGGFNVFQQVFLMTRGGPYDSTRTLALHIYDYAFLRLFMGQAASMAFVMFALVMVMTVIQMRIQRTDWEF
jgi:multiple sugar transport system permease protein